MELKKIWAVYFSGTGTTRRTVERIACGLAEKLSLPVEKVDFSRPPVRQQELRLGQRPLELQQVLLSVHLHHLLQLLHHKHYRLL